MLSTFVDEYGFELAAKIEPDSTVKAGYSVSSLNDKLCNTKGVIYILVDEENSILKIGGSGSDLIGRWVSYRAGTQEARAKGTCSVTNYQVSEFIRSRTKPLYLYAYIPPVVKTTVNLFNKKTHTIQAEVWKDYEKFLLDDYADKMGQFPLLSKNK